MLFMWRCAFYGRIKQIHPVLLSKVFWPSESNIHLLLLIILGAAVAQEVEK